MAIKEKIIGNGTYTVGDIITWVANPTADDKNLFIIFGTWNNSRKRAFYANWQVKKLHKGFALYEGMNGQWGQHYGNFKNIKELAKYIADNFIIDARLLAAFNK